MDIFHIAMTRAQARENLSRVPEEFREIVATTGAILAGSDTYACPFCERRVSLAGEAVHREECEKNSSTS